MQKNTAFATGQCYALRKANLYAKLLFIMRVSVFCGALLFVSAQLLAISVTRAAKHRNYHSEIWGTKSTP
jgi:hypothetical protein